VKYIDLEMMILILIRW